MSTRGRRILGIDPGSGKLGHALIEEKTDTVDLVGYGCIKTTINAPEPQKLAHIYDEMINLINELKPDLIAVEMLFFANNIKTAFSVGQARGVVLLVAQQLHIPVAEIAPLKLKKLLTGNGRAKKPEVQSYIKEFFNLEKIPKPDDAADAIAVALSQVMK